MSCVICKMLIPKPKLLYHRHPPVRMLTSDWVRWTDLGPPRSQRDLLPKHPQHGDKICCSPFGVKDRWCCATVLSSGNWVCESSLTFYELDMVKVNFSDVSSRRLVKSGRIMTGRAEGSGEREEEKHAWPGPGPQQRIPSKWFRDQWE